MLEEVCPLPEGLSMLMDQANQGNKTRQPVFDLGMIPVVSTKFNRLDPCEYNCELFQRR